MNRGLISVVVFGWLIWTGAGKALAQPDPALEPTFGSIKLKAGFVPDPHAKNLVAGGDIKTKLGGVDAYVAKAPDYQLNYQAGTYPLSFFVKSGAATTLLINLPDGSWIADGNAPDPVVRLAKPKSGRYDIYVGTVGPKNEKASLFITELVVAAPAGKIPPPDAKDEGGTPEERAVFHEVMQRLLQTPEVRNNVPSGVVWPPTVLIKPNSEKELNAFAAPLIYDGTRPTSAVITEGFIRKAKGDKNTIACVMGHELAHLLKKHSPYTPKGVLVGISREQELEADLVGVKIAVAAGYLEEGGPGFVKIFLDNHGNMPHLPTLKITHPSSLDRLQFLDRSRAHLWKAMAAYQNGNFLLEAEQYRSAESCFETVTKAYPDSQEALVNLGYARLMQYCDALDEKDLRKLGIGQIAAGCFYSRPGELAPTRGVDAELWKKAVAALKKARDNDPDGKFIHARANLALAYLVHPDGKPDTAKALALFEETANKTDTGLYERGLAAIYVNWAVAFLAAGDTEKARGRLDLADKLIEKELKKSKVLRSIYSQIDGAYSYNMASLLADTGKAEEKKKALDYYLQLLPRVGRSSAYWPLAYDRYAKLAKELDVPMHSRETLLKQFVAEAPRATLEVTVSPGKVLALTDKTADALKLLGAQERPGVPLFRNARVHRYHDVAPGIDVIGGDRITAIFLTSSQSPPVIVQMAGLGSKKQEMRVGMSISEFHAVVKGQLPDRVPHTIDDPDATYVSYPELGLAFRFANERVQEIAIIQIPLAKTP